MRSETVCDWVFRHAESTPDAPAVDSPDHRLSYALLAARIRAAAGLLASAGIVAGDKVVLALPNLPAAVVAAMAVQCLGAVAVEVSREWNPEHLAMVLDQTGARCAVFASRDARKLAPLARTAGVPSVLLVHDGKAPPPLTACLQGLSWIQMEEDGATSGAAAERRPYRSEDVTLLLYTSGSTGRPRAVMQTIENVAANTRSIARYLELTPRDRAMLVLPLSYCYGRSVLQTHLFVGGSIFLDPRFMYPRVVLEAIGAEGCTGFAGVPLTFELLRRQTEPDPSTMPSLRYLTQAGGAMSAETVDWVRAAFRPARLFVMYGQTEATARLSYLPPERAADKRGSAGIAIPDVDIRIVDDEGNELPRGERGHVVARGPNITPGYFRDPEETDRILRAGWLWTGDIGLLDEERFLFLLGRAKEILKIGGHRVSPTQIEAVLAEHAAVADVAVASVPDPLMGEVPAALVVAASGALSTEPELRRFCAETLPQYMVPRFIRFVNELPRNAAGKLLRERVSATLRSEAPKTS